MRVKKLLGLEIHLSGRMLILCTQGPEFNPRHCHNINPSISQWNPSLKKHTLTMRNMWAEQTMPSQGSRYFSIIKSFDYEGSEDCLLTFGLIQLFSIIPSSVSRARPALGTCGKSLRPLIVTALGRDTSASIASSPVFVISWAKWPSTDITVSALTDSTLCPVSSYIHPWNPKGSPVCLKSMNYMKLVLIFILLGFSFHSPKELEKHIHSKMTPGLGSHPLQFHCVFFLGKI